MIRILIVEDQPAVRQGLLMRLEIEPDLLVVGDTSSGQAALRSAPALDPDVILVDIEMPGMDGITTTSALHAICPRSSIIILSIHDDKQTYSKARQAGAKAFVTKASPANTLLTTIRQVALDSGH